MKAMMPILSAVLAVLVAVGCDQGRRDLGLPPRGGAVAPAPPTGSDVVTEEGGSVPAAPLARVREGEAPRPRAAAMGLDDQSKYEARLEGAGLPLPKDRPLLLADPDEGGSPRLVNTVLAEVNGEVITREDILGPLRPQIKQWRREYSTEAFESRVRQVVDMKLRQAISRRLVVQEAKARLSEEEKKEIDAALAANVKDLASREGSPVQLEAKIKAEGATLEELKTKEREQMLVQRFLREKIAPRIHITHSELLNHYNQVAKERYVVPTKVHLSLILIKKSASATPEQAQALAGAVHARASSGEDFARLAERYSRDPMASKGGDWGLITRGSFRVKEVDDALFGLQAGEVGPLVETEEAFYIVKALARQEGRTIPLAEVQPALEEEIRDRKYNEMVSKYIQELYERSYVRVMLDNL